MTVTVNASDVAGVNDPLSYEFDFDDDGIYEVGPVANNSASHTYADDGTYTVQVRVTDGDGGAATAATTVTVRNVAPTLTLDGAASVNEGSTYTLNLASSDPGRTRSAVGRSLGVMAQ